MAPPATTLDEQVRRERLACLDDLLRMLRTYEVEPTLNVEDLMLLAEYLRTGEVYTSGGWTKPGPCIGMETGQL